MEFDWTYAQEIFPDLLRATLVTLQATFAGMAVALVLGLAIALARTSRLRLVRYVATAWVEFIRGTPLLVQLFVMFYLLPQQGITLSPLLTGIVTLGINYSAYTAEVYRGGIEGVPREQWEAAAVLGLPRARVWSRIVLPQAIPPVVPVLGNYLISMYKETALLSVITVQELLGTALSEASATFRYLEPLTIVAVIFTVISYCSGLAVSTLERRIAH